MSENYRGQGRDSKGTDPELAPAEATLRRAGAVHDINQMLAVIMGRAELLLQREATEPCGEDLKAIVLAAGDAAAMLKRLQRGLPQQARDDKEAAVNLRDAAEAVSLLIRPTGTGRWDDSLDGTDGPAWVFERDVPDDFFTSVPGQVVREVLSNLLVNALEVLPGGGHILLDAMADAERVILTVADDGPGLDNETARRIFEPGFTSHEGEFRGIGLAGSRQLLKCFDGRLDLGPNQGSGAQFVLDLPRVTAPPLERGAPAPGKPAGRPGVAGLRVLVVDDEPTVRDMLSDVMAQLECTVSAAGDAKAALKEFEQGGFDIALIDQTLPGRSGLDLAAELRERDASLVVVLISGWGQEEVLAGADPAVVDLTGSKPMEWNRITEIMEKAAGLHRHGRSRKG